MPKISSMMVRRVLCNQASCIYGETHLVGHGLPQCRETGPCRRRILYLRLDSGAKHVLQRLLR